VTEEEEQSDDERIDSSDNYYSRLASYLTMDEREQMFVLASIQPGNPVYVVVLQKAHVRRSNNILVSTYILYAVSFILDCDLYPLF
jgi:hypothetical protein